MGEERRRMTVRSTVTNERVERQGNYQHVFYVDLLSVNAASCSWRLICRMSTLCKTRNQQPHSPTSSFPTTPVNLLPTGSPFFPINTHALSSNRTTLLSFLCSFFFVLTTTTCRISPHRTLFAAETCAEFEDSDLGPKLR